MNATNINMIAGDTATLGVTVTEDGVLKNITGYTFYFTARNKYEDTQFVIYKKVTSLTNPTQGETDIILDESDTEVLCKKYIYKIYCVSGTGVKTTLFYGELNMIRT